MRASLDRDPAAVYSPPDPGSHRQDSRDEPTMIDWLNVR